MPRTERLPASTPELDAAELEWWSRFAPVSERVWTFEPSLARALRGPYLRRAASYLLGHGDGNGRILDLGCGSGFTSRFFARLGASVTAVDSSPDQIKIAREAAAGEATTRAIDFRVADVSILRSSEERFDGVIAQAFLHHLASDELERALQDVSRLLTETGRAWFYEPVFFPPGSPDRSALLPAGERLLLDGLGRGARRLTLLDAETVDLLDAFDAEAVSRGYFLSPKEVPFRSGELIEALDANFQVERARWETVTGYQLASLVALLRRPALRRLATPIVRLLATQDSRLGGRGSLERFRGLGGYGFAAFYCCAAG